MLFASAREEAPRVSGALLFQKAICNSPSPHTNVFVQAAVAYASRKSHTRGLSEPGIAVPPVVESPLFRSNPLKNSVATRGLSSPRHSRRVKNEGGVSKENESILWIDVFSCRGCLGHIPSANFAAHILQCSSSSNSRVRSIYLSLQSTNNADSFCRQAPNIVPSYSNGGISNLSATVCGCPLE